MCCYHMNWPKKTSFAALTLRCPRNTSQFITIKQQSMTFICYRLHPDKTGCQGSLNAYVQPQPHHSTHAWKQTQGPDAQHAEVSGVESLTSLTNRSLLQWPAHRPFLHTHTEWLISSLSTPPRLAAAQLTATFITLERLSLYYTLWAHGETNHDGFKIGQLWALAIFHVFALPRG